MCCSVAHDESRREPFPLFAPPPLIILRLSSLGSTLFLGEPLASRSIGRFRVRKHASLIFPSCHPPFSTRIVSDRRIHDTVSAHQEITRRVVISLTMAERCLGTPETRRLNPIDDCVAVPQSTHEQPTRARFSLEGLGALGPISTEGVKTSRPRR
jgi:hypothetical protein